MLAIYVRESTKKQVQEGFNFENQKRKIFKFMDVYDLNEPYKIYEEKGYSAKTLNRPAMNKLKQDIVDGLIDKVIVYKLDRLIRRHSGYEELKKLMNKYHTIIISVREMVNTSTAIGRFIINNMISTYELEQDLIGERTKDGLEEGAMQGYFVNGGLAPFGYDRYSVNGHNKLKINEEQKSIIHKMKSLLKAGYPIYQIQILVNDDDYMKSINKTFCENQILNILRSKLNIGLYVYKNKEYTLDSETIFTKKEYGEVQELLQERTKNCKYQYLFARKIRSVDGSMSQLKSTVKKDKVYLYYFDFKTKNRINESDVKKEVIKYMRSHNIVYKKRRNKCYKADIKQIELKKATLKRMYDNMALTTDAYIIEMCKIEKELEKIQACYNKYVKELETYFDKLDFEKQEKLIWQCIKYIEFDFSKKNICKIC